MKKILFSFLVMLVFVSPVMASTDTVAVLSSGDSSDVPESGISNLGEAPAEAMGSVYQAEVDKAASEPGNEIVETDALNDLYFNEHE